MAESEEGADAASELLLNEPKPVFLLEPEAESLLSDDLALLPKLYDDDLPDDEPDDPDDDFCEEKPLLNEELPERLLLLLEWLLLELACASPIPATDTATAIVSTIILIIAAAFICIIFFPACWL